MKSPQVLPSRLGNSSSDNGSSLGCTPSFQQARCLQSSDSSSSQMTFTKIEKVGGASYQALKTQSMPGGGPKSKFTRHLLKQQLGGPNQLQMSMRENKEAVCSLQEGSPTLKLRQTNDSGPV